MAQRISSNLTDLFDQVSGQEYQQFIKDKFPVTCPIPGEREPEFGYIMDMMEQGYIMDAYLSNQSRIKLIDKPIPDTGFVLSLPQDTVDENGFATNRMQELALENRRRLNFNHIEKALRRFDVSFKDAGKSGVRREWEAHADCLNTGYRAVQQKVVQDIPKIAEVVKADYRVLGAIMVSRQITNFSYMLSDESAVVDIEANNDAGVITTPHADCILDYRREKEFEITQVHLNKNYLSSNDRLNRILDTAISEVRTLVETSPMNAHFNYTNESKGAHTARLVAEAYTKNNLYPDMNGRDIALLQNVVAQTYQGKLNNLLALSSTIPTVQEQYEATADTRYNGQYFRAPHKAAISPLKLALVG